MPLRRRSKAGAAPPLPVRAPPVRAPLPVRAPPVRAPPLHARDFACGTASAAHAAARAPAPGAAQDGCAGQRRRTAAHRVVFRLPADILFLNPAAPAERGQACEGGPPELPSEAARALRREQRQGGAQGTGSRHDEAVASATASAERATSPPWPQRSGGGAVAMRHVSPGNTSGKPQGKCHRNRRPAVHSC